MYRNGSQLAQNVYGPSYADPSNNNPSLTNGTSYSYYVTAVNSYGESGASNTVTAVPGSTTLPPPTALKAIAGNARVGLYWTSVTGAKYNLYRGGGGQPTLIQVSLSSSSFTDTDATLVNGTTYQYSVACVTANGQGSTSASVFATPSASPAPPPAPLLAVTASTTSNSVSWTGIGGASSYNLYRSTTAGGEGNVPFKMGIASGPPMDSYGDTGLSAGTYYYKVASVNSVGEGPLSQEYSATPGAALLAAPNLKVVAGNGKVTLSWGAVANATGYNLYHSNGQPVLFKVNVGGTTYTEAGLTNGSAYSYSVYPSRQDHLGQDSQGNGSNVAAATPSATSTPLSAPLLAVTAGSGSNNLQWTAVSGVSSYNLYRSTAAGGEGAAPFIVGILPGGPMSSYPDTGLTNGTRYFYQVAAVGTSGEAKASNEASATPSVPPLVAPTGLVIRAGNGKLSLSWKGVTNATTYNVYRSVGNPGQPILYQVSISGTTFLDTGLTNGTTYYYQVAAVDADGQGTSTSYVSGIPNSTALPPTLLAATAGNGQVTLTWNSVSGATSYNVYRVFQPGTEGSASPFTYGTASSGLITYLDKPAPNGLANGSTAYYMVAPVNAGGEGLLSNEASATPLLPPPPVTTTSLILLPAPTQYSAFASPGQVALTWNVIPNATSYNVYRTGSGAAKLVQVGVTGTAYTDTGLTNDVTYTYQIAAVRQDGQGHDSQGILSAPILVAAPDPTLTLAAPTANPNPTSAMTPIAFMASASEAGGGGNISYAWNFGDSTTASTASASHTYAAPGIYLVTITASDGALLTEDSFTVLVGVDLVADTNRDGVISAADELGKSVYTKTSGAIFSVNYDNDDGRTAITGDATNLPGGTPIPDSLYFDDTGAYQSLNPSISVAADTKDYAPLKIRSLGAALPSGWKLFLKASSMQDIQAVYVYPSIAAGQTKIWGGPTETKQEIDVSSYVTGGDATFGIEGLFFENDGAAFPTFNGLVTLTLELRDNTGKAVADDTVQMKVAPWLILPDSQPSTEVWAIDLGNVNASFRSSLTASGQIHTVVSNPAVNDPNTVTQWFMDHLKMGYCQRPGGPKSYEVFRLPYDGHQPTWPLNSLMMSNVGTFQLSNYLSATPPSGDFGGNLGALPPTPTAPLGQIVMGNTHSARLGAFLKSQGPSAQPFVEVPTKWLEVGHIDEVIGFTDPMTIAVADPRDAYSLLQNLPGTAVFFSTDTTPPASGITGVATAASTTTIVVNNINWSGMGWKYIRIYSGTGAGQIGEISSISITGTTATITVDQVWDTGSAIINGNNASGCVASYALGKDYAPSLATGWDKNISATDKYVLVKGTQKWIDQTPSPAVETPALITVQEVLADSSLSTLNNAYVPTQTQTITSTLSQATVGLNLNFVSVPTIYVGTLANFATQGASAAFTPGLANVQEIGSNLYFPKQFGPLDASGHDVFEKEIMQRFPNAIFVDDWNLYHRLTGEVHCGTAMKRQPFSFNWWQNLP